jgi:arylsulfatase A-like enzyme
MSTTSDAARAASAPLVSYLRAAHPWLRRHLRVTAIAGLGLSAVGQVLVWTLARGEHDGTAGQSLAAVVLSAAGWVLAGLLLALATRPLLGWRLGRVAALGLSAALLATLAFIAVAGTAMRIMSGSYVTVGGVMFSFGSREHFIHAAVQGYVGVTALCLAVLVGSGLLFAWLLSSSARPSGGPWLGHLGLAAALSLLVGGVYARRADSRFTRGMFVSAPLLALVSSLDNAFELTRASVGGLAFGESLAPPGPDLAEGPRWLARIKAARGPRPNVLLVMLESVAPDHLGLLGYHRATSPEIDRLGRESLWMRRAWATATHSNYAQMAVLSSLFPRRVHGLDQYTRIDYPRLLFHDVFHALGYATATISSQDETWQGMRRFQSTGTPTFFWYSGNCTEPLLDSGVEKVAPDGAALDVVLDWLSHRAHRPWALYLNLQGTHFPYTLPAGATHPWLPDEPDGSTYTYLSYPESERAVVVNRFDNALRYVDEQLGRLRRYLAEAGELDDTFMVITADHGELFFDKGLVTHGRSLYEVEARVPLWLRWPGHIPAEQRDEPVSHLDVMPTVLDYLDLPPHPSWQGRSFRTPAPEAVGKHAIFMNIQGLRFADALVCWPYKLMIDRTGNKPYLFDLASDPDEEHNLVEARPTIAALLNDTLNKQLIAQLDYHRAQDLAVRQERFQPRLRACPSLP